MDPRDKDRILIMGIPMPDRIVFALKREPDLSFYDCIKFISKNSF